MVIAAIARRATGFPVIGGDILEYRDTKLRTVADAGIFDQAAADRVVYDAIAAWGLADDSRSSSPRNAMAARRTGA